ncbi:MAG: hypothetical protein M3256_16080, partial [Actinomycetota bacterium]|nr:hypothetical protein [Actinomycetota bacterium]
GGSDESKALAAMASGRYRHRRSCSARSTHVPDTTGVRLGRSTPRIQGRVFRLYSRVSAAHGCGPSA